MLLTLISSLFFAIFFFLVGTGVTFSFVKQSKYLIPISVLTGLSLTLYFCWSLAYGNSWIIGICGLGISVTTFYSIVALSKKSFWAIISSQLSKCLIYILPGYLLIYFSQFSGFVYQGLKLRTGPDLMGWVLASQYFEKNLNVSSLSTSLERQLGARADYFADSVNGSVYSLPSYNEQVQAEFLIGSRRIGLPALVGYCSRLFGFLDSPTILISIISLAGGLTSTIILIYAFTKRAHFTLPIIAILFSIGSPSVLGPIYEGGVWHAIFIPVLLVALIFLVDQSDLRKEQTLVFAIIYGLIISTNSDIMIASIPIVIASAFLLLRQRRIKDLVFINSGAVLLIPGVQELFRALISRKNDAGQGGWQATFLGLPGDFLGLTLWQNSAGQLAPGTVPNVGQWAMGFFSTILAIAVFIKSSQNIKVRLYPYFISLIAMYVFFFATILNSSNTNNYIIWKLSFLWVLPFCIVLISFFGIPAGSTSKNKLLKRNLKGPKDQVSDSPLSTFANFLTSWSLVLLVVFQLGWIENSRNVPFRQSISSSSNQINLLSNLLNKYDLVSYCARWGHAISIYGDLHLISQRGKNVEIQESVPARGRMIMVDSLEPVCFDYVSKFPDPKSLMKINGIEFLEISEIEKLRP